MSKKPLPQTKIQVTNSRDSFTVAVPVLDLVIDRVVNEIGVVRGMAIYKKAVMAAGRIGLKAVRAELLKISGKFNKKNAEAFEYGNTGALWKSMKVAFRTAKSGLFSYSVVGADRGFQIPTRRGRQMVYQIPGSTVHLVNDGFVAVGRIPDIVGRQTHYQTVKSLRVLASMLKMEKPFALSMAKLIGAGVDRLFIESRTGKNFAKKAAYIAAYKEATMTHVYGKHFMEIAGKASQFAATQEAMKVMQMEFDRVLNDLNSGGVDL